MIRNWESATSRGVGLAVRLRSIGRRLQVLPLLGLLLLAGSGAHGAILGPTPYVSFADSPFDGLTFSSFTLEDFEDDTAVGALNVSGVTVNTGFVCGTPVSGCDSVDADNGAVDGSGAGGQSWITFTSDIGGFEFTFTSTLPTHAGLVWTDGGFGGTIVFEAFDENGASLGTASGTHAGVSSSDDVGEDRFYGATNAAGISKIRMTMTGVQGGIEIDHLQFGVLQNQPDPDPDPNPIPEPSTIMLVGGAILALGLRKFRG